MAIKVFGLKEIESIDGGRTVMIVDKHILRAAQDCYLRPGDDGPRKVTLTMLFTPVLDDDGGCVEVKMQCKAESVVPKHQTKLYSLGLKPSGQLVFNEDSPQAIDQKTLLGDDDE